MGVGGAAALNGSGDSESRASGIAAAEHPFNWLLVPERSEWTRTGEVLARIGEKYGYERIGRARLTNDALIGTSVARRGIILLTTDRRDFDLIAEFCSLEYRLT